MKEKKEDTPLKLAKRRMYIRISLLRKTIKSHWYCFDEAQFKTCWNPLYDINENIRKAKTMKELVIEKEKYHQIKARVSQIIPYVWV